MTDRTGSVPNGRSDDESYSPDTVDEEIRLLIELAIEHWNALSGLCALREYGHSGDLAAEAAVLLCRPLKHCARITSRVLEDWSALDAPVARRQVASDQEAALLQTLVEGLLGRGTGVPVEWAYETDK